MASRTEEAKLNNMFQRKEGDGIFPGDQSWLTNSVPYKAYDAYNMGMLPGGYSPSEWRQGQPGKDLYGWGRDFIAGPNQQSLPAAHSPENAAAMRSNLGAAGRDNNVFQGLGQTSVFNQPGSRSYESMMNNKFQNDGTDLGPVDPYSNLRQFRGEGGIDFEDKESIKELQGYLGVEQDGMFGPQTEQAWRQAVGKMDQSDEKEVLKYDFNKQALNDRVDNSKTGLGGLLKQGYTNVDKNVFGGWLPWGHRRGLENQSAEEYYGAQEANPKRQFGPRMQPWETPITAEEQMNTELDEFGNPVSVER